MPTIAVVSLEPGSWKTFLSMCIAHYLQRHGKSVVCLDADNEFCTARHWHEKSQSKPFPVLVAPLEKLEASIASAQSSYEWVVVDVSEPNSASSDNWKATIFDTADIVVMPYFQTVGAIGWFSLHSIANEKKASHEQFRFITVFQDGKQGYAKEKYGLAGEFLVQAFHTSFMAAQFHGHTPFEANPDAPETQELSNLIGKIVGAV